MCVKLKMNYKKNNYLVPQYYQVATGASKPY